MPYDDGFNTWFYDEDGKKVYIGPKIEFGSAADGRTTVNVTESPEDVAKARAAGYEHVSTTISITPAPQPQKSLLRRILGL